MGPRFGEFHSCCCLPLLPGLACSIHETLGPPFSGALTSQREIDLDREVDKLYKESERRGRQNSSAKSQSQESDGISVRMKTLIRRNPVNCREFTGLR